MDKKNKPCWKKPICESIDKEEVTKTVLVSACSEFESCHISVNYIDSIPGLPPVETM